MLSSIAQRKVIVRQALRRATIMVYAQAGQLLKVGDVAERLQLGKSKVFELVARGEIDSLKIDGARRFTEQAVQEYIARRQAATKATA
jgi:excisionase family DNA binding protein